jgi:hypothetical protein
MNKETGQRSRRRHFSLPALTEQHFFLFKGRSHAGLSEKLGAHITTRGGRDGVHLAVSGLRRPWRRWARWFVPIGIGGLRSGLLRVFPASVMRVVADIACGREFSAAWVPWVNSFKTVPGK